MQVYQNQMERTQAPRKAYRFIKHLHIRNNRPKTGRANPGSSERDHNECVSKGELARAEEIMCIYNSKNNYRYKD